MEKPYFAIGMIFNVADEFRKSIREYTIKNIEI